MKLLSKKSCLPLLIVVLAMILTSPLLHGAWPGRMVLGIVWSVLFGLTGYIVFPTRRWLWIYVALMAMAVVLYVINHLASEARWSTVLSTLIMLVISVAALYAVLRHALLAEVSEELDRIFAAATGYFMLAIIWSRLYELIILADPLAFKHGDSFISYEAGETISYYSMITLTTVGYGDITPVNDYASLAASLEGAFGTLYIAVVIATLIGRLLTQRRSN